MVGQLCLEENDLDFRYVASLRRRRTPDFVEVHGVLDLAQFFSLGGHHVLVAVDCAGESGHNNPHCGPVVRHGESLFSTARGFFILSDGMVVAEFWNGTFSPDLHVIANGSGQVFTPLHVSIVSVLLRVGYASGEMSVEIRKGVGGQVVFSGSLPIAAQPWPGSTRVALGGIASGFVPPANTGCVEQLLPRSAPDAKVEFSVTVQLG